MSTMISLQTILWSALAAAAGIGLPVLVLLVWKFKFCRGAKLFPAVVGAVTFVVFAQVLEGVPKAIFFGGGTGVSQYVLTHAWAYTLIGCLLAGVFEEVGRYLAFRFLLKRYTNRRDAVTYGIGHGGIEAILVLGLTAAHFPLGGCIPGCPAAQGRVSGIGGGAACAVRCSRRFIPVRRAAQYLAGGSTAAGALPGLRGLRQKAVLCIARTGTADVIR